MPVLIDKYSDATRTYTSYKLYSKDELRAEWSLFEDTHIKKMSGDDPYVTYTVSCEQEALVLTALLIRRAASIPACFYYDKKSNKLLINCQMAGNTPERLREIYLGVLSIFSDVVNLKNVDKDPLGQDLFNEIGAAARTQPMQLDNGFNVTPWSGRLHEHMGMGAF